MSRVAAVAAIVLTAAATAAACSSDTSPSAEVASSSAATTSTTTSTTATTVPPTVPRTPAGTPQEAATTFINAWKAGNQLLAATVALPAAVDAVFAAEQPASLQARGCNSPPPGSPVLCVYRTNSGNEVQLRVAQEGDGWIVEQAIVSPAS